MLGNFIGGFIVLIVGFSMLNIVSDNIGIVTGNMNATHVSNLTNDGNLFTPNSIDPESFAATILKLIPGFFALGIVGMALGVFAGGLRSAGIIPKNKSLFQMFAGIFSKENIEAVKKSMMSKEEKLVYDIKPMYSFSSAENQDDKTKDINSQ